MWRIYICICYWHIIAIDIIIIMSNVKSAKTSDSNIKEEYDQFVFN